MAGGDVPSLLHRAALKLDDNDRPNSPWRPCEVDEVIQAYTGDALRRQLGHRFKVRRSARGSPCPTRAAHAAARPAVCLAPLAPRLGASCARRDNPPPALSPREGQAVLPRHDAGLSGWGGRGGPRCTRRRQVGPPWCSRRSSPPARPQSSMRWMGQVARPPPPPLQLTGRRRRRGVPPCTSQCAFGMSKG